MDSLTTAGMATIPERLNTLERVLDSITPQVDFLVLSLNGFNEVPKLLDKYDNVLPFIESNDMGDANKFLTVDNQEGYYFSCDDDIIYPKDYVETYKKAIDKHKCVISIHGCSIPDRKIASYYKGKIDKAHCLNTCAEVEVHICGSGVSGFHTDHFKPSYERFKAPNMADIWLAMQAQEQGVKRLCIEHSKGWITGGLNSGRDTIYETHKNSDKLQTEIVNGFNWL
jgi:hypothetical protein